MNLKYDNLKTFSAVVLSVIFLDEAAKHLFASRILNYPVYENRNALFGIPFNYGFAFVFLAFIFFFIVYNRKKLFASCESDTVVYTALIFGGIMGNIYDRISNGFVIDYLTFLNLFSFNISDLAILSGSSLFFLKIIRK